MYAFRCKSCGHLETAAQAGDNALPIACSVCSAGVTFMPNGVKQLQPDNWQTLADLKPEQLFVFGLKSCDVEKHVSVSKPGEISGRNVIATAQEKIAAKDRN